MTGLPGRLGSFIAVSDRGVTILGRAFWKVLRRSCCSGQCCPIARAVGVHESALCDDHSFARASDVRPAVRGRLYAAARSGGLIRRKHPARRSGYMLAMMVGLVIVAIFSVASIGFLVTRKETGRGRG